MLLMRTSGSRKRPPPRAATWLAFFTICLATFLLIALIAMLASGTESALAQQQSTSQELPLHSDNGSPRGIWSDGSTMWVADFSDRKLYAYSLADSERLDDKDISLGNSNFRPVGLWSDDKTIWVLNSADDKIWAYSLTDGSREETRDIRLHEDNDTPTGIWSDGTTIYAVDQNDRKLFAYALSDGARQSDSDIDIPVDRPWPVGFWSNSDTFWISYDHHQDYSEDDDRKLYAFRLEDGERIEDFDVPVSTDPNSRISGLWSDGTTIWVTDKFHRKIFSYQLPQPILSTDASLSGLQLSEGTLTPDFAATTTDYTATVSYEVTRVTVAATTSDSFASVEILDSNDSEIPDADPMEDGRQVDLAVTENVLQIEVTAEDEVTVQTYTITLTRQRPMVSVISGHAEVFEGEPASFTVDREIAIPEQLEVKLSVTETESLLPASEEGNRTVTIPSGATTTAVLLTTDPDDDEWESHSTVTAAIREDNGYVVSSTASSSRVLILDDDFPEASAVLSVSPSPVPEGATTTATISITTQADRQPHGSGGSLTLSLIGDTASADDFKTLVQSSFNVSADDFSALSVGGDTRYRANYAATISTVDDSNVEVGESFDIQVSKGMGSSDSLTLAQPSTVSIGILDNDAALSYLELSGITLSPEFSSHVHNYTAQVAYTIEETTAVASVVHEDSRDPVIFIGGVVDSDGVLSLDVGENEVYVQVVAEDATSTVSYQVNVTRARPSVRIESVAASVDEGQVIRFSVSRHATTSEPLDIGVTVSETGSLVQAAELGSRTVTIPGEATTSTTTVSTQPDDDLWEPHSVVTATVIDRDTIEVKLGAGSASTQVNDNDFPEAKVDLVVAPNPVSEGATVSATLKVTTKMEQDPHGTGGTLTLTARENTAQSSDFGRFGQTSFQVEAGDFERVEVGGADRFQASYTAAVAITDDRDSESDESFYLRVSKTDAPRIELPTSATTTVVISANDSSTDPTLSQLILSSGILSPPFSSTTTRYSARIPYGVEQVTVRPVVNSDGSMVAFLDDGNGELTDANGNVDGHQIDLEVGQNIVKLKVTAEDEVATETYTIELTRQQPEVSILPKYAGVTEGSELVFTIMRNAAVSEGLEVRVEIDETGEMVADVEEGNRAITLPSNSTSTDFAVSSEHDDEDWEVHSTVSATITASDAYTIKQGEGKAETLVKDDDFPAALATLSASPSEVSEGDTSTLSIAVTTTDNQEPHGGGGTLTVTSVGGTATSEDYGSLSQATFPVSATDFSRVDVGSGSMVYRALYTATFETADDNESEPDETVVFRLGKEANSEKIEIQSPSTSTVTILANDASSDASLSGIGLSEGTLNPAFATSTTGYAASVAYGVEYLTLDVMRGDDRAKVSILDARDIVLADAAEEPGYQVRLSVGANTIKVKVTAEDGTASQTYVITITRSKPEVGIREVSSNASEGEILTFNVSRDASVAESLAVTVNVDETNMLLLASAKGRRTITIPAGATSTSFAVAGDDDDEVWEEHSTVTASIIASTTYDIAVDGKQAVVQLEDNDFPEASAVLQLTPNPVTEGDALTTRVTVTTTEDHEPHGAGGVLILTLTGGTAQANDFEPPHVVEFNIAATDFNPIVVSGDTRYRASYTATTTITDDADPEEAETLLVAISGRDAGKIELPVPSTSTATIAPSDLSGDASLTSLTVSDGSLTPEFASSTTGYMVKVDYGVERTSITPLANDSFATISIEASPVVRGKSYVADLPVGTSTINVLVTAQDSISTRTYSIVVVRAQPEVSISSALVEVAEGALVNFTVVRSPAVSETLDVRVQISESGNLVPDGNEGSALVSIPSGATSTLLAVPTDLDDEVWDEHSEVTAALISGDDYLVVPDRGSARVLVKDDDFPDATMSLAVSPNPVAEGETVTVSATVRTDSNEQPHRGGGTFMLEIGSGTAQSSDYGTLSQTAFSIAEADFAVDTASNTYVSEYSATIDITRDSEVETGESFDVSISLSGDSPAGLTLSQPDSITVNISDFSAGLAELDLTGVTLTPQFSSDTVNYTGSVPYSVVETVVSATTTKASSGTTAISVDGVPVIDGRIPLSIGETTINIQVSSKDSSDTRTYAISVTREKPEVSITGTVSQSTEGDVLGYTVSRSTAAPDTLDVKVEVHEDGDMVPAGSTGEGSRSVIIPAGATSTTFAIQPEVDDEIWEAHSNVSVAVKESDLYLIKVGNGVVETLIQDDDFPESIATLSVDPASVIEGQTVTLSVAVTTVREEEPHADGGTLTVTTANDSAIGGVDYAEVLANDGTLNFLKGDFIRLDEGGQARYQALKHVHIVTHEDNDDEGVEKFVVTLDRVPDGPNPTSNHITLDAAGKTVTVRIDDAPDAELAALTLDEGTLDPPFGTSTRSYSAEVSNGTEQLTVSATTSRDSTIVTFHDLNDSPIADLDDATDGHQVPLAVGENIVKINVSDTDETVLDTYTLSLTRVEPVVGIASTTATIAEGDTTTFVVYRDSAPSESLSLTVSVSETGALLPASPMGEGTRSIIIPGRATSTTFAVVSDPDDDIWEDHSTVLAAIVDHETYAVAADSGRVEIQVFDNDFPQATATLSVAPNRVTEGREVTAIVTVTTQQDQQPHRGTGAIQLVTLGVSATSGADFTPPAGDRIAFSPGDFVPVDIGGRTHYSANGQLVVSTVDDEEYEGVETFTIGIVPVTSGVASTTSQITFDPNESLREVSITDNDDEQSGSGGGVDNGTQNPSGSQVSGTGGTSSRGGGGGTRRAAANHEPKFVEGGEARRSVVENSALGTKVGRQFVAEDKDEDKLTFDLEGKDRSSFTVNPSSGRLYTAAALDREDKVRYYLTVVVSDGRGGSDSIEVTIVVEDEDEAPSVTGDQQIAFPEQSSGVLANYNANDPENGNIRWTLSGVDASAFHIEAGALAFRSPPDFEDPTDSNRDNSYELSVSASDSAHTITLDIVVTVSDLDETPSPTPTPLPTPNPTPTSAPPPNPTHTPTVTPTIEPTSTPRPSPTKTPPPQPTKTPRPTPVTSAEATPMTAEAPTVLPRPTVTPRAPLLEIAKSTPIPTSVLVSLPKYLPTNTPLNLDDPTPSPQPTALTASPVDSPTPLATPHTRVVSTEAGSVPAWLMLSITFWAVLATGVGVYIYLRHR